MGERSSRKMSSSPLDDFFAAFTYKGEREKEEKVREVIPIAISSSPNSVLPPPRKKREKKKKKESSSSSSSSRFEPSSHLLTTIDGERRVVSSYFKLPPGASPPLVLDRRDVDRAYDARLRPHRKLVRRLLHTIDSAAANPDEFHMDEKLRCYKRRKQRSSLSAEEKKLDVYKRLDSSTTSTNSWVPPPSPFALLQEKHYFDPWRVLLICMLLNITTSRQVKSVLENLFAQCPTAEALLEVQEEELQLMLKPLGLQNKRARAIKIFTQQYLGTEWTHVSQLYGVGKYAADAYAIFCVGKPEEVIPQDNKLVDYWKFVCEHNEKQEQQVCLGEVGFRGTGS